MSAFELSPRARIDLLEIWERIARDDVDTADRIIAEIEETIALIASRPGIAAREKMGSCFDKLSMSG
jgi:plasmid stabilization system protein ParE